MRVMRHFGLGEKILEVGGLELDAVSLRDFEEGELLVSRPGGDRMRSDYGDMWWYVI
jgi:hypothetical protein